MKNYEILHGDCVELLPAIEDGSVNLIYLDPPFFTQKTHRLTNRDRDRTFSFDDMWQSYSQYGEFIQKRLQLLYQKLEVTGSLFFHCDRNAAHIVRLLLDNIFGVEQFRAEIIWHYRRWSNSKKGLLAAHQIIYHYSKTNDYKFNTIYTDYSNSTNVDQILQRRERDSANKSVYAKNSDGKIITNGGKQGVPLSDVWDIPYLNPKAKERVGYPTQKPLLLLERILQLTTSEGDFVLDPFCGSGTTIVAAKLLNRNGLGMDVSRDAVKLARERLANPIRTTSNLLLKGRESYKSADETALAMLTGLNFAPVQRNKGIDAILEDDIDGTPIPVRVQRLDETILEAGRKLYRAAKSKNANVMLLITIRDGGYLPFAEQLPQEIKLIDAPAKHIHNLLNRLRDSAFNLTQENPTEFATDVKRP